MAVEDTASKIEVVDWMLFPSKTQENHEWEIHVPFFLSRWSCLFGRGCPGVNFEGSTTYEPGVGCCHDGAYLQGREEYDRIAGFVANLTEEDLEPKALNEIRRNGWSVIFKDSDPEADDPDYMHTKTRKVDGRCIFSRRDGKGCALLHYAGRMAGQSTDATPHTLTMPTVCWQLPVKRMEVEETDDSPSRTVMYPWDVNDWPWDNAEWWCVSDKAAYTGAKPLYLSLEVELRAMMGDVDYEFMRTELDKRNGPNRSARHMPAELPSGVSLIPLIVENKTRASD